MLDNVINFDFPPRSKLFVHRAGRAGRMGRPGSVYSLVGPDELPYFFELMLFLGMKPLNQIPADAADYDPMNFYFGSVFQEILDTEEDWLKEKLESMEFQQMIHTTENAMKLYNKTRPSPSPESVTRAKDLIEIHPHPLIRKFFKIFLNL
jgi:ATP-dependent RNA helicase DDX54/DBP10